MHPRPVVESTLIIARYILCILPISYCRYTFMMEFNRFCRGILTNFPLHECHVNVNIKIIVPLVMHSLMPRLVSCNTCKAFSALRDIRPGLGRSTDACGRHLTRSSLSVVNHRHRRGFSMIPNFIERVVRRGLASVCSSNTSLVLQEQYAPRDLSQLQNCDFGSGNCCK